MHALRANCGSFLQENLRQEWLSDEERRAMEGQVSEAGSTSAAGGGSEDEPKASEESGFPAQWPLFGSPALTTIRVTTYHERGGMIFFVVQPSLEGFRWSVERTYDDFSHLHKALVDRYGISRALLPSKKLFGSFGSAKAEYLKGMRTKLDQLLKAVVQKYPVPPKLLLEFCSYPFCDVLSITQALAAYFFKQGDHVLSNNKAVLMSPVQLHCIGQRMTLPIASSGTGSMRDDFGNLLDFLMQLQKLKIAPSTEDQFTLSSMEDVTFDLSLFKSLTFLAIDSIDLKGMQGREALTSQLEGLDIRRCLVSLQEVLLVYPIDPTSPVLPVALDHSRALRWTSLKTICFKLNNITSIDKCLQLVPCLEFLDLSYNYIERIENLTELPHLKVVDLSHNKLSEVCDLHLKIGNLLKLGLAHNQLTSLAGFAKCFSLLYLDLSSNQISEVSEVGHLSGLPELEDIYLHGNPIKQSSSYRSSVFSQLPSSSDKMCLDGKKANHDELELSASLVGSKGHRRVPSRTADIKPDRYEPATQEAKDEFEEGTSVTSRLEEMRKTGGDKWLSLLNTDRTKHSVHTSDGDDTVVQVSRERGKKRRHHKHLNSKPAIPTEQEAPAPPISVAPCQVQLEEEEEEEMSKELQEKINNLQSEKLHLLDLPVTVMEYSGPLDSLSKQDVDQKLVNSRLEECSVCVDTSIMRLLETVLSTSKTRCQRDLALLEDIRFHEGKKKGVCLRFAQFSGSPFWVVYCVHDLGALARLYVAVQQGSKKFQKSVVADTTLPQVSVSEETDSSPAYTQSEPVHDVRVHTHTKPATHVQTAAEAGAKTDAPVTLQQQFSKPPSTAPSVHVPPHTTQTHSRSPSPRRKTSSKQLGRSNGNTTPILPVKSIAGAAEASMRERTSTAPSTTSMKPSPTSTVKEALVTTSGKVQGESASTTPSGTRKKTDSTNNTKMLVSFTPSPSPAGSPYPKGNTDSTNPTETAQGVVKTDSRKTKQTTKPSSDTLALTPASKNNSKPKKPTETAQGVVKADSRKTKQTTKPSSDALALTPASGKDSKPTKPTETAQGVVKTDPRKTRQTTKPSSDALALTPASGKDSKPTKLTTGARKIIKKPGLKRESLVSFFNGKVAREQKETLMNILWGGASLTSTPGCEVEAGLFLSDKGMYLLQVVNAENDSSLSWYTENAPLICSFHAYHVTLSQVKIGIFDQSITFECVEKGALKRLVVFPRTGENMLGVLDNLKAALDSSRIPHCITSVQESILSVKDEESLKNDSSQVLFVNPDVSDLQKLKESLVRPNVVAHLCSHMTGFLEKSNSLSFTEEVRKASEDAAAKFEVLQYVVVSEISSDLLPIGNGVVHFRPNVLILTNSAVYLCKDEIASWPTNPDSPVSPPFSRCTVLDSHPVASVTSIEMCDKAQAVVWISDPIYEFRINFSVNGAERSKDSRNWQLCVYDRQYIDQFFSCLQLLWHDVHHTTLTISYTAEPLTTVPPSPSPPTRTRRSHSFSEKHKITLYEPSFYKSRALGGLAGLTSSERLQFFKEYVSEAEFMKSDEVPLAIFLGFCSTGERESTQIEACVIASRYAIYLVSDVDNIRKWLDGRGGSSFSRMSLLNKQGADRGRCFFRVWINDIKEIHMGFFYLSMRLTTSKVEHSFAVHAQDASSMLALLSALSCSTNLRNTVEQKMFDDLLSDYIDLGGDSLSTKAKEAQKTVKTNIEFREPSLESHETLKQILLCISPSITRRSTVEQSTSGLHIIQGQVMMMIEELNIRGTHTVSYQLQLVLLSNSGLFVCANSANEHASPAVLLPSDLKVKRWYHIDRIEQVEVVSSPRLQQCKGHVFSIDLQSQKGGERHAVVLVAQNNEQLRHFLYSLSLLWYERNERHLPIYTI